MTKKQSFIVMIDAILELDIDSMIQPLIESNSEFSYEDAMTYFEGLKASKEKEKVDFTDNGKNILIFMQQNKEARNNLFKAKDIADGLFISSRSVSGAIRKLVTDGYVEKIGETPITYTLTDKGEAVSFNG
jgi:DNA-binding MarR family transcriptional regulator